MKPLLTIPIFLVSFTNCQLFYPSPPIEPSEISTAEETNLITPETIYSLCKCNLTPGTCDPFCCCDPNCSSEYNLYQEQTLNRPCGGSISDFTDTCFNNNYLYKVNPRKGVQVIQTLDPTVTCVRGGQISSAEFIPIEIITDQELVGLSVQTEIMANQSINSVSGGVVNRIGDEYSCREGANCWRFLLKGG